MAKKKPKQQKTPRLNDSLYRSYFDKKPSGRGEWVFHFYKGGELTETLWAEPNNTYAKASREAVAKATKVGADEIIVARTLADGR